MSSEFEQVPRPTKAHLLPGGPLRTAEVRELWAFLHGDVMEPGIRRHLRQALGLCPRHTWAYAIVEIELWIFGGGARGGHQPFDVCVLYDDLLATVIHELTRRRRFRSVRRRLMARASCRICDASDDASSRLEYGGFDSVPLTSEANELAFTVSWCRETEPVWRSRVCPQCLGAGVPAADAIPDGARSALCRPHLLGAGPITPTECHELATRLTGVRSGLLRLLSSMTATGSICSPEDDASWIEALGWFASWDVPLALTSADRA